MRGLMTNNKKGKELLDNVNNIWRQAKGNITPESSLADFKDGAKGFLEKITGDSTGQAQRDTVKYQKRKMKHHLMNRGIFEGDNMVPTPEQIAQKIKRDAKAKLVEEKRVEKRRRGSNTLKRRKMQSKIVVADIESGRLVAKYQDGYKVLYKYFKEMKGQDTLVGYDNDLRIKRVEKKLRKLGLIK